MALYHYCDFRNGRSTRTVDVIASLLCQAPAYNHKGKLLSSDGDMLQVRQRERPVFDDEVADDLERILLDCADAAYVVIDGLDECVDLSKLLPRLLPWTKERR